MKPVIGPLLDEVTKNLLRSRWRKPILRRLLALDNFMDRWVSTFSVERGLHPKHRLTQYHQFFLDHVLASDSVLDIGCGIGFLAYDVATKARVVVGIDFDPAALAVARQRFQRDNLRYVQGDATTFQREEKFDVIILSNVLEHIDNRVKLLLDIKYLAPTILIRVPMIDRDWLPLLKREVGVEYRLDPTHTIEYTERVFRDEMMTAQLKVESLVVRFGEIYAKVKT